MFALRVWLVGIPIFCFGMFGYLFYTPLKMFPALPCFLAVMVGSMILCWMDPEESWGITIPNKWRHFRQWAANSLVIVGMALYIMPVIVGVRHAAHDTSAIIIFAVAALFYAWNSQPRQLTLTA